MSSSPTPETIVVGAGIAGLVLARRLALSGRRVVVIEAEQSVGGQVWRHTLDGVELDAAADSFATREGSVAALLSELGLGADIVLPLASPAWIHRTDGASVPLPATGVLGIPGEPLAEDVIRAIGQGAARIAHEDASMPANIGAYASTLGELVRARMGDGVLEGLVAPVVRGVHSREPDQLPLEVASPQLLPLLRERGSLAAAVRAIRDAAPAGSQVAGIRGGIFRLVDRLEAECERLGVRIIRGIRIDDVHSDHVGAGAQRFSGRVVLTAADLITAPNTDPSAAPNAGPATTRRVTLVTLVVRAPALDAAPRGTGVLVSAGATDVQARALTHLSAKWAWVGAALPGRHALRLSYDEEVSDAVATARHDAEVLLGACIDDVVAADVIDVHRPIFAATAPRTDGIFTTGEAAFGTGLATVITQAERTAREILTT